MTTHRHLMPLAAAAGLLLAGWSLTGVVQVQPGSRAIYLRLGAPVAVLRPGLHLLLPWPFSHLRLLDFGAVHDVALAGPQGLHALYRVGLTNAQAMDSAFATTSPDALVQAVGSQACLDRLNSGLEILAITAPPQTRPADKLRDAQIGADAILAQARGDAAVLRAQARRKAAIQLAEARATEAATLAAARSQLVDFNADRAANQADSRSFLLERYFASLTRAIGTAPKTIIDHRLNWPAAPELDLRPPPGIASELGK